MDEEDENALTEDLDVGDSYNVDVKPDISSYSFKKKHSGPRNRCPYGCDKVLAARTIDYHRTNGCRMGAEEPLGDTTKRRNYCCGVCYSEFVTRCAFFLHLTNEHDVRAEVHKLQFKDKQTFGRFVKWIEMEGGAHFRHKSGSKRRASGRGIFMACNRSGYVGTSFVDPLKNRTGPYRTGYTCTAFIHGTEYPDGTLHVEMCGDHYGHDARMRLPNVVKHLIAQKQMEGESPTDIITYLKRQFSHFAHENTYAQRICLVDHDELRTLLVTTTKKWETIGIPTDCEIWEEELLDRASIIRQGVPRLRGTDERTTQQIAEEEMWPRPRVFIAKLRTENGFILLPELCKVNAEARKLAGYTGSLQSTFQHELFDDMGMVEPVDADDYDGRFRQGLEADLHVYDEDNGQHSQIPHDSSAHTSNSRDNGPMAKRMHRDREHNNDVVPLPSSSSSDVRHGVNEHRERGAGCGRRNITRSINNELQTMERMANYESSYLSDTALASFASRLRVVRGAMQNAIDLHSDRKGDSFVHQSGTNGNVALYSRLMSSSQSRQIEPPMLNVKYEINAEELDDSLSDDEPIVSRAGCLQYNSALWK